MSFSIRLFLLDIFSLFRPINSDELIPVDEVPKKEVLIIRNIDGEIYEDKLAVDGELKITSNGDVYEKRSGKWILDDSICDIEIING